MKPSSLIIQNYSPQAERRAWGMGSEWTDSELGTFIRLQRGHDLTDSQRKPGNVPVMGSAGQNGFHDTSKAKGPGIVLGPSGASFGKVHYTPNDYWPHNTALYVTDFQGNDELFTYYFLKTIDFTSYNTGSSQPSLNRNHLYSIPVNIPPLPEQKAIAHILGTLDDKIELNRRMNATLEGMPQALFKSWFVDFDPVIDNAFAAGNPIPDELAPRAEVRRQALANGTAQQGSADHPTLSDPKSLFPAAFQFTEELGWIPEGWSVQKISEVAELTWGDTKVTKKSYTEKGHTAYSAKGPDGFLPYHDFDKVGIVISEIGSNSGQTFLAHGKWSCIKNTIRLWADESDDATFYLYHAVSAPLFWPLRGSAQPFISQTDARNCPLLYPPTEVAESFGATARALLEKTWDNESENSTLTKIRDTLLPKLISGELRLRNAE